MLAFEGHILGLNHSTTATTPSSAEKPGSSFMKNEPERQKVEIDHDFSYSPSQRVRDQDFDRVCVLGRGAFGKVYLVRREKQLYAMKVLKKASLTVDATQIKTERQILEQVRHPFIVQLFYAFQTPSELHMILQYAVGGELFRYLAQEQMFEESTAGFYAAELVLALSHLHSLGIVYRDLKPENCLLDRDGHVLLTDFGLSKVSLDGKTNTICGTVEYMAPEVLAGLQYDQTVDWWSLGILIYDMLTGSPPFRNKNRDKTMNNIMSKKINMPYYLTSMAKDLLNKLLRKNPHLRLGAQSKDIDVIKRHFFFRKIDWDALLKRQVTPPITPFVSNPEAAENFDPEFTSEDILVGSPNQSTPLPEYDTFRNFSYCYVDVPC